MIRFESIIHEFDPYFNYRSTQYYVEEVRDRLPARPLIFAGLLCVSQLV